MSSRVVSGINLEVGAAKSRLGADLECDAVGVGGAAEHAEVEHGDVQRVAVAAHSGEITVAPKTLSCFLARTRLFEKPVVVFFS